MSGEDTEALRRRASELASFLVSHRWLSGDLVKNFFVSSHWDKVPAEWHAHLDEMTLSDLGELLERPAVVLRKSGQCMFFGLFSNDDA